MSDLITLTLRGRAGEIAEIARQLQAVLPCADMGESSLQPDGLALLMMVCYPSAGVSRAPASVIEVSNGRKKSATPPPNHPLPQSLIADLWRYRRQRDFFKEQRDELLTENLALKAELEILREKQDERQYLSIKEAAERSGISIYTCYRYCESGYWRAIRSGDHWLVAADQPLISKRSKAGRAPSLQANGHDLHSQPIE